MDAYLEIDESCVIEEVEITEARIVIGGEGGGSIALTTNLLKGDNAGNAVSSGIAVGNVVQKQPLYPTPTTIFEIIQCLQAAGLCA